MNREEFSRKWGWKYKGQVMFNMQAELLADLDSLSLPPAEGAEDVLAKGKVLMYGNIIVDPIMLPEGIYATKELRIYLPETTIEHLIETGKMFRDETQTQWLPDSYFDNLSKCELIDVDVVRDATLHAQRLADKMVEKMSPTNEQIHAAALAWARDHSEAPDKDCPTWLIRDYEAAAYFVRQCYGCWNKTDLISEHYVAKEATGYPLEFIEWLIKDQEIFFGELNEEYILNDNIHVDGRKLQTIDELFNYWVNNKK